MKKHYVLYLLFLLITPHLLLAQQSRELQGTVEILDEQGQRVGWADNVKVTIAETQGSDVTNSNGFFRIPLPEIFRGGDEVELQIKKPNYVIYEPLAGKQRIPADPMRDQIKIRLLPQGSKLLLSAEAIEQLIADAAENAEKRIRQEQEQQDLSRFIRDWAEKYGFGTEEVQEEVREWVAEVNEARSDDSYREGLAAFAEEEFSRAGVLPRLTSRFWTGAIWLG